MPIAITIRHRFLIGMASETIIDISPESLSTSVRNDYRHRPESAGVARFAPSSPFCSDAGFAGPMYRRSRYNTFSIATFVVVMLS